MYVDAMNVIGSRPDGWWRDRDAAIRRLADRLQALPGVTGAEVVLVVDGGPIGTLPDGRNGKILVRYARRRGRDAADDRIIELLTDELLTEPPPDRQRGACPDPARGTSVVVTSDRLLRERAAGLGAGHVGPRVLLATLDRLNPR